MILSALCGTVTRRWSFNPRLQPWPPLLRSAAGDAARTRNSVTREQNKQTIQSLCADVDRKPVEEFFARMDEDYFAGFPPGKIAEHIQMSASLSPPDSRYRSR